MISKKWYYKYTQYIIFALGNVYDKREMVGDMEFKKIEKRVVLKMVNRGKNRVLLEDIIYRDYLDLSAVYHLVPENGDIAGELVPVTPKMMESWEVTEDELFETAVANLREGMGFNMKNILTSMLELMPDDENDSDLMRMLKQDLGELVFEEDESEQMFVISDSKRENGAAVLVIDDLMAEYADTLGSDLIVIPASAKEIIVARDKDQFDIESLRKSIYEVNEGMVDENDFLSDNAYRYQRDTRKLTIV